MFSNVKKVKSLFVFVFAIILILAVFSQINATTKPKPTSDVGFGSGNNLKPSDWLYYKSSNDLTAYLGKKSSTLPTVRYQKGGDYLQFSMTGASYSKPILDSYNLQPISSTTSVSLETNSKQPNTPTLFYRNILDGVDATYQITNIPFKVKEEIVLKTNPKSQIPNHKQVQNPNDKNSKQKPATYNLTPTTFLFSAETTGKPVKQKDGSIAFFDNDNNYLFQLDKPFMVDANLNRSEAVTIEINPKHEIRNPKQAQSTNDENSKHSGFGVSNLIENLFGNLNFGNWNLFRISDFGFRASKIETLQQYTITLSASSEWLSTATYPVIIDPTVTHNADSNFTGQMNRIADSDTTTSTQLESSYLEATKDPYTVLLLHFNEANGTTVGITDMASSTRVITANDNASTTSYVKQLGLGNSAAFDGTGDYLTAPDSDDFFFGTDSFSIDMWVKFNTNTGNMNFFHHQTGSNNEFYWYINHDTNTLMFVLDGPAFGFNGTWDPVINTWYHVAFVRSGNTWFYFIDGVKIAEQTSASQNISNKTGLFQIGVWGGTSSLLNGYLDEFRILKGRALTSEEIKASASRRPYAVYTSPVIDATASVAWNTVNWTEGGVNTGDGEQPYNTNSLVAQWDFNDTSGTTLTASSSGSCITACNGTLTNFASTASQDQAAGTGWTADNKKWGAGGLMFDGTNDYVSVPDNADFVFGTNDFSIDSWIRFNNIPSYPSYAGIMGQSNGGGNVDKWGLLQNYSAADKFSFFYNGTPGDFINFSWSPSVGQWYYLALVRNGNAWFFYVNGILQDQQTKSVTVPDSTSTLKIGGDGELSAYLNGILDSVRIYKGRALSASEILSNYQAGNIEIQTRTGATSDPNDGSWEAWKPTTGETQLLSMDSDTANWHSDIMASTTIATSTETVIKAEGTGSLKVKMGMASTTAGTVALWHFEETGTTTGTYLYDETANNNDATTTGTTVVDGIFGKARKFNGTSDYATVSSSGFPTGSASRTIMAWAKSEDCSNSTCFVFGYGAASAGQVFGASGYPGGNWWFQGYSTGDMNTGVAFIQNKWHHIAVSYDGTTVRFYLNGLEIANGAKTLNTGGTVFHIGDSESDTTNKWKGLIDEMAVYNRVLSADEIAETYRMGANHHLTRQVSAVDMSAQTKLSFWIGADRPGTGLEAMIGESDYANYELASSTAALSANTVLYIKGDEIASSTSIKDSSFSGKAITANGNARTAGGGKIGNSVYFDGTGDYLTIPDSDDWAFGTGDFSIDAWVRYNSTSGDLGIYGQGPSNGFFIYSRSTDSTINIVIDAGATMVFSATWVPVANNWYHIALTRSGNNWSWFVNGNKIGGISNSSTVGNYTGVATVGSAVGGGNSFPGNLDEFRIIKGAALTPDQIRQAYEYGLRTHPITIDFGASLQPSNLISSGSDYSFAITATTSGFSATTSNLYLGDTIIVKENRGGTESVAQGVVNSINTSTGTITVPSWSGSVPSGGFTENATVFKWQRGYFDITGAATTTRDAITNLTLRPTNGAEGRTIYLDDFRYNTNYLTASSSSAITSGNNRYLQYRAIFTSTDTFVSPFLSAFNTLYTSLANSFPSLIGVSGGGFLSF